MKKFTKLWQVMMIILLSSSIVFAQKVEQKRDDRKNNLQVEQKVVTTNNVKVTDNESINKLASSKANLGKVPANFVTNPSPSSEGFAKGSTAWAYNSSADEFINFDTDVPGTFNLIAAAPGWDSWAADFDNVNTTFYYIINDATDGLQTVDVVTGAILTTIGTPSFAGDFVTGMACDKTTGIMYVIAVEPNNLDYSSLWTLDLTTAVATLVGQTTPGEAIIDIAVDGNGDMYGFGIVNDEGLSLNKATAAATVLGSLGFDANYGQGMAYDPGEDIIYLCAYNNDGSGGQLRTFDPVTGNSTLVGGFPSGNQTDAFAFPGTPITYLNDLAILALVSPVTGPELGMEDVTVNIFNFGTDPQSNFDVYYTIDGGAQVTETVSSTINGGESYEYTFTQQADLSAYGIYVIEACTDLTGDENPDNDCQDISVENFGLPTMDISPDSINVILDPFATTTEYIDISNNGNGTLNWNAEIVYPEGKSTGIGVSKDVIASEEALKADVIATGTPVSIEQLKNMNIPIQTTYQQMFNKNNPVYNSEQKDNIDTIGGTTTSFVNGPRTRGNLFSCTEEKILLEFLGYHGVTADPTQMWMLVYEGATQVGVYDLVFASDITPAPLGTGWISSGEVNYILQPGKFYMIVASFEQQCEYFCEQNTTPFPYPVAFGEVTAGAGWDYAPTSNFPPDATQNVPASAFGDPVVYYQQLISASPQFWLSIDPSSGDVDPGNTDTMAVFFDATDILPGTVKTANIHFTSTPDVGTVTVPVSMTVGVQQVGYIEGNVILDGIAPYNIGDVEEVVVSAGPYFASPDTSGGYSIEVYPGTYDVAATALYGYADAIVEDVVVGEGQTVSGIDLTMDCLYGMFTGTVTDIEYGNTIEGAEVVVEGTEFADTTNANGEYEIFIEAGTYDLTADHQTYLPQTMTDVTLDAQTTETVDFELQFQEQCEFSVVLWDDYGDGWNGGTLTISVDGTVVLDNITLASGSGPETYYFYTGNGADVTCVFTAGGWPYECSYYIYDNDGNEVFADGVGGVDPVGGTFTSVCIQFVYGDLAGTVTELATGNPIEGAIVMIDDMTDETEADGTYLIEDVMIGAWDVTCTADGYNIVIAEDVEILEGQTTTQDFALTSPTMDITPTAINITIDPNAQSTEYINIANNGDGSLAWSAEIEFLTEGKGTGLGLSKDVIASEEALKADVIATGTPVPIDQLKNMNIPMQTTYQQMFNKNNPVNNPGQKDNVDTIGGNQNSYVNGPRTRGNLFTCTEEKLLLEFLGYHGVTADPTQMWMLVYEGATQVGVYDLVFASDVTPAPLGTGWISSGEVNYILQPGKFYMIVASFEQQCGYYNDQAVTPFPYPVAFGEATAGAGWSYAPTSVFPPDVTQDVPANAFGDPVLYYQQLISADPEFWLTIDPTSGDVDPGNMDQMTVSFDATDILPGTVKTANIHFTSTPDVGTVTVPVSMTVEGLIPAINLNAVYNCTDVELDWEMPTGGDPDSWNVYRDGTLLDNVTVMEYTNPMVDPLVEYSYTVTAVYGGDESQPTSPFLITVPTPDDLEPLNLEAFTDMPDENDVTLTWDAPAACLAPDGYNVFRDGSQINTSLVTELTYIDPALPAGFYEYYVVAVYYFGESDSSNPAYTLITSIEEPDANMFRIFPNPATDLVNINSTYEIKTIQVLNNIGQVVIDEEVNTMNYKFNVSTFERGIYYIKLDTDEGQVIRKIAVK